MKEWLKEWVDPLSWGLAITVVGSALLVWGQGFGWHFEHFSSYLLFPLFGLLAFSLMWTHYIAGGLRRLGGLPKKSIQTYLTVTGWVVLVFIVLHPGLLIWQLWRDGFGLPPQSYLRHYVAPNMEWVALLGTISLGVFLAYELKRWFGNRKWWIWVAYGSEVAMLAIFYHGLRLGHNLVFGWYRMVWLFYGASLVLVLIYNHWHDHKHKDKPSAPSQLKSPHLEYVKRRVP